MSRGKKLDLSIGASFDDDWALVEEKSPASKTIKPPKQHTLVFKKEKRRGKTITLVGEFFLEKKEAQKLLKKLKSSLACGGSFKEGFMEFQGELQEKLKPLLLQEDFRFKN
jgi:translation initiation factor 1